ncbi:MAG: leucine-rich repeat domain-containing protein [Prevotella sp.]|nr:leucine-rich repeat domain-containing protein [Prevotella sp.]
MKKLRFSLLFILLFLMPVFSLAIDNIKFDMSVGDFKVLKAPKSTNTSYPNLSTGTSWSWSGPIEVTSDYRPASIAIRATGTGTATVICRARYWDASVMSSHNIGFVYNTCYWEITINGGTGNNDPDPTPDPTPGQTSGPKDFIAGDIITREIDGVAMKFSIQQSDDYAVEDYYGSAWIFGFNESDISIPLETSGHLTIPEYVPNTDGCTIKWIYNPKGAYTLSPSLRGLKVKGLMQYAFCGCSKLTSVEIPSIINRIPYKAFWGCTSLTDVTVLAPTPPVLMNSPFPYTIYNKATLWVPKGKKEDYKNSDWNNYFEKIEEIYEKLEYKDGDTFTANTYGGVRMTFQVISAANKTCRVGNPESSEQAIDRNRRGAITIPSSVNGFSVVEIGKVAFQNCEGITSVNLPNGVKTIESAAFYNCKGLTKIIIPNTVEKIGKDAFCCENLTALYISDLASWLNISMPESVFDWHNSIHLYLNNKEVKKLIIPNTITAIKENAFCNFGGLTSIIIPKSVKYIGDGAFFNCIGLKTVYSEILEPFDINEEIFKYQKWNDAHTSFYFDFTNATLYVPEGTKAKYQTANAWKKFANIIEYSSRVPGDLNDDGEVDVTDVVELIDMVLAGSNDPSGDINGDGDVDVTDVVELIDMVLAGG